MVPVNVKSRVAVILPAVLTLSLMLSGCSGKQAQGTSKTLTLPEIEAQARQEGQLVSLGMPDTWANYKANFADICSKYGLKHVDTDMSSAEAISKIEAEKDKPSADMTDIGITFAPVAVAKGITTPYKTSHWAELPNWAKDPDGNWTVAYTGTISFLTNKKLVKNPPKSWDDLLKGSYKVAVGDVTREAQAQSAVLAAAMAYSGDEKNIKPGLDFFAKLAQQKRISPVDPLVANIEKGEVEVALVWDFNALNYANQLGQDNFDIAIPAEGSLTTGYALMINKYAPHPNAAKVALEYLLSDEGQLNYARGFAKPIRSSITIPDDVKAKMLPAEEYKSAKSVQDYTVWGATAKQLPQLWQEKVLIYMQ